MSSAVWHSLAPEERFWNGASVFFVMIEERALRKAPSLQTLNRIRTLPNLLDLADNYGV